MHAACTQFVRHGSGGGKNVHKTIFAVDAAAPPTRKNRLLCKQRKSQTTLKKTLHLDCTLSATHSRFNTEDKKKRNRHERRGDAEHMGRGGGGTWRRRQHEVGGKKWKGKCGHGHIDEAAPVRHPMAVQTLWPWGKDPMTV